MFKDLHPARLYALLEAAVAAAAAFLPLTGEQVATLLAFVAIATGERVVRRASAD